MKNIIEGLLAGLFLGALFGQHVDAQNINAASCSASDVQTAFNAVTASTKTVNIPAGSCTWTAQVTLFVPSGNTTLSIIGAGNMTTTGGGDVTVITDNDTANSNYLIQLNTGSASSYFRFAGLTVSLGTGAIKDNGMLAVNGFSQNLRLDHLHLNAGPYAPIRIGAGGWIYGVIDHSIIENSGAIEVWSDDWNNAGGTTNQNFFGDGSWAAPTNFGSASAIFIEDNIFNSGSITGQSNSYMSDCYSGGRVVYRYNTMNNVGADTHPTGGAGADIRGCRSTEIYNNTFNGAVSPTTSTYDFFYMQSGTALVWGNTATGYQHFIDLHTTRLNNVTYGQTATPNGWGYCGTSSGLTGGQSAWDQKPTTTYGYKCLDEPGTGRSDLLTGTAPSKVDSVTGTLTWPNQALEPVYEWLNTFTPASGYSSSTYVNGYAPGLTQNTDYYAHTSSFTGASGVGSGLLAARPLTCTPLVSYWATDTTTLYQCSATNTWTAYYTPYTYPHPLTQGTTVTTVTPPTSLSATAR